MSDQGSAEASEGDADWRGAAPIKSKVVAGIFVLFALQWALVGVGFVAFADAIADLGVADADEAAEVYLVVGLVFFSFALLDFAVGYGLWRARSWGWYAGVAIAGLSTLFWGSATAGDPSPTPVVFLLVAGFCTWALWDDREQFLGTG